MAVYPSKLPPTGSGVKIGNRLKQIEITNEDRIKTINNSARIGKAPLATRRRNSGQNTISNVYKSLNRKMYVSPKEDQISKTDKK